MGAAAGPLPVSGSRRLCTSGTTWPARPQATALPIEEDGPSCRAAYARKQIEVRGSLRDNRTAFGFSSRLLCPNAVNSTAPVLRGQRGSFCSPSACANLRRVLPIQIHLKSYCSGLDLRRQIRCGPRRSTQPGNHRRIGKDEDAMPEPGNGRRMDWFAVGAILASAASSLLVAYLLAGLAGFLD